MKDLNLPGCLSESLRTICLQNSQVHDNDLKERKWLINLKKLKTVNKGLQGKASSIIMLF